LLKIDLVIQFWDQVTSSTGSGGGGGTIATGDGDLVGTIKPWAGMTAPINMFLHMGKKFQEQLFQHYLQLLHLHNLFFVIQEVPF